MDKVCGSKPIRVALVDGFGGNSWRRIRAPNMRTKRRSARTSRRSSTRTGRTIRRRPSRTSKASSPRASRRSWFFPTPVRPCCPRSARLTKRASRSSPTPLRLEAGRGRLSRLHRAQYPERRLDLGEMGRADAQWPGQGGLPWGTPATCKARRNLKASKKSSLSTRRSNCSAGAPWTRTGTAENLESRVGSAHPVSGNRRHHFRLRRGIGRRHSRIHQRQASSRSLGGQRRQRVRVPLAGKQGDQSQLSNDDRELPHLACSRRSAQGRREGGGCGRSGALDRRISRIIENSTDPKLPPKCNSSLPPDAIFSSRVAP